MAFSGAGLGVVTGASSGIGRSIARQFVEHGYDVVIAAEDDGLDEAADELLRSGRAVRAVRVDLAEPAGVDRLYDEILNENRPVDLLALNAGVGLGGEFVNQDLREALRLVKLDVLSTVHLARLVLPSMVERGAGRVLVTSSIASMTPGPFQVLYNASKSFVQSFAEGLAGEVRDHGVTVTAVMPGPTESEFFERAGLEDTKLGKSSKADPDEVARQAYEAMMAGERQVVAGPLSTKVRAAAMRVLPDSVKSAMHRKETEPGSATG
jgi:short-subunit dehydrogenase